MTRKEELMIELVGLGCKPDAYRTKFDDTANAAYITEMKRRAARLIGQPKFKGWTPFTLGRGTTTLTKTGPYGNAVVTLRSDEEYTLWICTPHHSRSATGRSVEEAVTKLLTRLEESREALANEIQSIRTDMEMFLEPSSSSGEHQ